jgi:multidrug efflux pump subunit AcrA (membrane-fusion protein)
VIEGIAKLAPTEESPGRFYPALLEKLISALAADGGVIWTRDAQGGLKQECLVNPPDLWSGQDVVEAAAHQRLVETVLATGEPQLIPPNRKPAPGEKLANPTDALLILFPWRVDQTPAGLIEIFQRPGGGPRAERGYVELLEVVSEFVAEFDRNCQLRRLKETARDWVRFDQFARQVHASLDLRGTAYTIVNEARRLFDCDRVSLAVRRGGKFRLLAVSGVDTVNRRAELTRRLENLCESAAKPRETIWFPSEQSGHPPEVEKLLSDYLDESHARSVAILPLAGDKPANKLPNAVLTIEKFFGTFAKGERSQITEASAHIQSALANCLELDRIPFSSVLRRARGLTEVRTGTKVMSAAGVAAAIIAAAMLIKADFTVVADGNLQPARLRDVFARADGTVVKLSVEHGQHVHAGDLLAVLRRPQLDLEFKQVFGELQTAQQKLISLEAERLQASRDNEDQRRRYGQVTAQEEELREMICSLQAQYEVLKAKQTECEVRSPIDGEVLTWNVNQLLDDRPVTRGQTLLTIGDLTGPWKVDVRIPDRQAGHVLAAQEAQPDVPLEVSCLLAMNPRDRFSGTLAKLGMRSETTPSERPYVEATVDFDRSAVEQCTAGAGVRASIHCGRRSVGYVWLHDLYDTVRTWLFF